MNAPLCPARRDELVETFAKRLDSWNLSAPAILLLQMHAPLAFLGGQLFLATAPFLAVLTGDRLARELALFCLESENIERLIARLEKR